MTSSPTTSDMMTWSGHFESPQLIIPPMFAPRSSPIYLIIYIFNRPGQQKAKGSQSKQRVPDQSKTQLN